MNSKMICGVCAWSLMTLAGVAEVWANSAPEVTSVTASQRTDGSMLVDIGYDLADADGDPCMVWVTVSDDGGSTWDVPATSFTGDVGAGITPGAGKAIVWDCGADLPGAYDTNYKVRVCADDGHGPGEMVLIPGGEFQMGDHFNEGDPDELPVHAVYVGSFDMDVYEVTNQQYADALNWAWAQDGLITVTSGVIFQAGSGTNYPYCDTTTSSAYSRITWNGSTFGVVSDKESHPMVMVSWYGAVAYCNWRSAMEGKPLCYDLSTWSCNFDVDGYRLPTEAEWEKAAGWDPVQSRHFRFGEHSDGCGYNCLDGHRANYNNSGDPFEGAGGPETTPAAYYDGTTHGGYTTQSAQSYYGCYDMSGNVWECCHDWYDGAYYGSSPYDNPQGPANGSGRVLRSGHWYNNPVNCRSASRTVCAPDLRDDNGGFRCAAGTP